MTNKRLAEIKAAHKATQTLSELVSQTAETQAKIYTSAASAHEHRGELIDHIAALDARIERMRLAEIDCN